MIKLELNNKVFYLLLTILILIAITLVVFAVAPPNGHDVNQLNLKSDITVGAASNLNTHTGITGSKLILGVEKGAPGTEFSSIGTWAVGGIHFYSTCCGFTNPHDGGVIIYPRSGNLIVKGNVGIGKTDPQAKLHVAGDLKVDGPITQSCQPGYKHINNEGFGTCIQVVPIKEAGCFNDECLVAGMRACNCMEIATAFVNDKITPTTNALNPAGEWCVTEVGHCQGSGLSQSSGFFHGCQSGLEPTIAKIASPLPVQRPKWKYSNVLRPDAPQFLITEKSDTICKSKTVGGTVFYGSARCCY